VLNCPTCGANVHISLTKPVTLVLELPRKALVVDKYMVDHKILSEKVVVQKLPHKKRDGSHRPFLKGSDTKLTDLEQRIVESVHAGNQNVVIGASLGFTEGTIKNYMRVIFDKTGVFNRVELALYFCKTLSEAETAAYAENVERQEKL
jgi:DNA-binding NarL/FixJ family response regulator